MRFEPSGSVVVNLVDLMNLEWLEPFCWERVHPLLYMKGMVLQVIGKEYVCF